MTDNVNANSLFIRGALALFATAAVGYPLWARISSLQWTLNPQLLLNNVFPLFGLTAFSLLWLHSLSGVFEPWLRQHIHFDRFVQITAGVILVCILAHPLLLLMLFGFDVLGVFAAYGTLYILLGVIGWLLLITYDIAKPLKKYSAFFVQNWNKVLVISNIGFLVIFFHSLNLGSDVQAGPLRTVWIFYGITAFIALVYTYAIKPLLKK